MADVARFAAAAVSTLARKQAYLTPVRIFREKSDVDPVNRNDWFSEATSEHILR